MKRFPLNWKNLDLEPAYYDPDTLMLHAMMACLGMYIEEMGGVENIERFNEDLRDPEKQDKNAPSDLQESQAERQETAADIWRWWKVTLPALEARRDDLLMVLYVDRVDRDLSREYVPLTFEGELATLHAEFRALEEQIESDIDTMLHRLLDIRGSLWT